MNSIVFYSKTIGKQNVCAQWVKPKTPGSENAENAFSYRNAFI